MPALRRRLAEGARTLSSFDPTYQHGDPTPTERELEVAADFMEAHAGAADFRDVARLLAKVRGSRVTSEAESPKRRVRLLIDVGADSPDALRSALRELRNWAAEKGEALGQTGDCIHGGPDFGWIIRGEFRADVTHESYFAAIEKMKAEQR